jgi:hypothetical protein
MITTAEIQANQFLLLLIKCCVLSCEAANTNFKVIKIVPDLNKSILAYHMITTASVKQ